MVHGVSRNETCFEHPKECQDIQSNAIGPLFYGSIKVVMHEDI